MEGIDKVIEGEVSKGISSVLQNIDAAMRGGTKVDAALSKEHIKGESSANLPPCLDLGKDNRRLGVVIKIEQPPETKKGQKMELPTDSLTTEKRGKHNLQKQK